MTDADLNPSSGNRIIAADVVDGELVLKRYDGTSEIFPMGGAGYNDGNRLQLTNSLPTLAEDGSGDLLPITTIGFAGPDGTGLDYESPTADGVAFGEDFVITSNAGDDKLWFRKPGLYVGQVTGASTSDGDWVVYYNLVSIFGAFNWFFAGLGNYGAGGTLTFDIGASDVVKNEEDALWAPGDVADSGAYLNVFASHSGTGPAFISAALAIDRVS